MLILRRIVSMAAVLTLLSATGYALAMDEQQVQRFEQIRRMDMAQLSSAAEELLEQKYPDENWDQYDFPSFVYTSDSVEIGYMIAAKESQLLGEANVSGKDMVIPCYCFCDGMGHKNLLYCFWKDGTPGGKFDDHAASCNICYGQAMLAFLWNDLGATHDEIIVGMEKKFSRLVKMREKGEI